MAPAEPPSPSASSTLLPFLATNGRRRGSLASLSSNKGEIDKEVLAQALDDIHNSASRSEALTSFHDYDGRAPKSAAKELVSNGVSGLYDKLKRGLTNSGPSPKESDAKAQPKTSGSRESVDTPSMQSDTSGRPSNTASRKAAGTDAASLASHASDADASINPTPATTAPWKEGRPPAAVVDSDSNVTRHSRHQSTATASPDSRNQSLSRVASRTQPLLPPPTRSDMAQAKDAMRREDLSTAATQALARVLSHHDVGSGDMARLAQPRADNTFVQNEDAETSQAGLAPPASRLHLPASSSGRSRDQEGMRPPLLRVGPSHLPGYEPSRGSSTDGGDATSQSSSQVTSRNPLAPSPNINSALQRRRTDIRSHPQSAGMSGHVPTHLKRRVISKAFWMKDENAKDCFYCGQPFSTFRRKHHCRTCGQIFDSKCTSLVPGRPFGQPGTIRLCKPCEAMIYGDDDDSTTFSDDGSEIMRTPGPRTSFSEGEALLGKMDGLDEVNTDTAEVMTPSIGIPASRRNREAKRRSAVIEFDAAPFVPRPASSHSLISLARRPRSSSHRRFHSRHQISRGTRASVDERVPFQSASAEDAGNHTLPAFHNDNIIDPDLAAYLSDEASEEEDSRSIFATLADPTYASPSDRDKPGYSGLLTSAMKKGRSRFGGASSVRTVKEDNPLALATKHLPKLSRTRHPSISSIAYARASPRRSRSQNLLRAPGDPDPAEKLLLPAINGGSYPRLVRSSAMQDRVMPSMELNHISLDFVRRLLMQLLQDNGIKSAKAWQKALLPIVLQCTDDVAPNVQLGDDMDIRHYIKLKKVPGGRPADTSYVSGVVFSKNVALKSMARSISFPRIAIITFSIEYARHQTHFMSLEPVIAQEHEYLRNLVARIAALQPQVLLVQRNVSGLALSLLEKEGIAVAYNIKESVLAAVARVTQTTMIKSVDKLAIDPSHLGMCESFEVKTFVHDGARRTYIYLSGCDPDLGCTLILRGADTKTLRSIKRITEFMCYITYNLKLETSLLRDEFVSIPTSISDQHDRLDPSAAASETQCVNGATTNTEPDLLSRFARMTQEYRSRIISGSPFVVFMPPHMLTQLCESEQKLTTYKRLRDQYAAADEQGDSEDAASALSRFETVKPEMVHVPPSPNQPKAVREYLRAVHQVQYDKTMHTYETQRRLLESFKAGATNPFDPFSHQTIILLHSIVSTINSAPCIGPEELGIGFYAGYNRAEPNFEEDCTLGQYVEDLCISASSKCKECDKRMLDHHRQYVHGYGQLTVSVVRQPAKLKGYEKAILMWSICKQCKQETTVIPMSDNTWKYSFGKYLELSFWSPSLHPRTDLCPHDVHKDYWRFFGFEGLAIRFQYDPVDIYDVVVPRSTISWKVETDLGVKNDQYAHFAARLKAFIDSVKKRLDSINVDTLDEKKSAEANEYLERLRQLVDTDHAELLQKLQEKYAVSRYYELIPLNRALRFMDEKALLWDDIFNDFERDYFPSETDIRKLATLQLKNMFLESSQPSASNVASDASDDEEGTEMKPVLSRSHTSPFAGLELRSEKAHNVLSSTIEEHRESIAQVDDVQAVVEEDAGSKLADLARSTSPREEQEQAVQREEVKHLDLAVAVTSLEEVPASDAAVRAASGGDEDNNEPFATQPKPLASGLLERIEQIRNNRVTVDQDSSVADSKIPRRADLKRQSTSPQSVAPPLLRAQSSPSAHHSPSRSADLSVDPPLGVEPPESTLHTLEKRLGEKLGVSRLANKVGKAAPSLIPRSVPKEDVNSTRVSALAKHFEQMSREFEKERLRERKQRALKSRQARANPLASSTPVVEVYRNATDAVGDRGADNTSLRRDADAGENQVVEKMKDIVNQPNDIATTDCSQDHAQHQHDHGEPSVSESYEEGRVAARDEDEGSDTEGASTRSRDVSDPTSANVSSGILSPSTSVPDIDLHHELAIPDHRKNVWFNYLAEFWSKRSASGWSPLEYPLHATEHVFEDSDIIVREDEPSSVIALSLACADYQAKVKDLRSQPKKSDMHDAEVMDESETEDVHQQAIEASLLSDTGTHMKYSFAHGQVKASCKIFYAEAFDALRRRCGVADRFVESLSRCLKYDSKGGKTKSLFLKTLDNRFIIKSLQEVELKAFSKFAPDYFAFMSHTLFHGVPSVIAKMLGLFQVSIKNPSTGMVFSYYLLVMENLFYERNPTRRFDLKGSMRNRKIESTGQPDEVLLDENLVETIFESPLFVREHARKLLQASVWNDTMWLCKQNVMDYSLMAGFDDERKELIVGIIDCIRTYTWDKKLESWIKDRGKNKPTITSPKDYRNRFRVSMMQYVLQAPNCWHQFLTQMAPPKTLKEKDGKEDNVDGDTEVELRRSEG